MIFQPDFKIKKLGNLIEIDNGSAVTFYPKDFSKTLKSIITKIKQAATRSSRRGFRVSSSKY